MAMPRSSVCRHAHRLEVTCPPLPSQTMSTAGSTSTAGGGTADEFRGDRPTVLALIPARGGSKGLPRKNELPLEGRPLVAWAARAALDAEMVDRVVGSTDDEEIAAALRETGVEIPVLRPDALAVDATPDVPVFLHMLDVLARDGYEPDIVVNVRPTSPLRTAEDVDGAIHALLDTPDARSVKAVSLVSDHPYKMWTLGSDGLLDPLLPSWRAEHGGDPDVPRQALPRVYRSSGAVDATWVKSLKEAKMFHPGPVVAYVIEAERDVDIDTIHDFRRAEELIRGGQHG